VKRLRSDAARKPEACDSQVAVSSGSACQVRDATARAFATMASASPVCAQQVAQM
jgi:hypothetical protein